MQEPKQAHVEHSPEGSGPPPRRGPSVDLDPPGIVAGKSPDRERRRFRVLSELILRPADVVMCKTIVVRFQICLRLFQRPLRVKFLVPLVAYDRL